MLVFACACACLQPEIANGWASYDEKVSSSKPSMPAACTHAWHCLLSSPTGLCPSAQQRMALGSSSGVWPTESQGISALRMLPLVVLPYGSDHLFKLQSPYGWAFVGLTSLPHTVSASC